MLLHIDSQVSRFGYLILIVSLFLRLLYKLYALFPLLSIWEGHMTWVRIVVLHFGMTNMFMAVLLKIHYWMVLYQTFLLICHCIQTQ